MVEKSYIFQVEPPNTDCVVESHVNTLLTAVLNAEMDEDRFDVYELIDILAEDVYPDSVNDVAWYTHALVSSALHMHHSIVKADGYELFKSRVLSEYAVVDAEIVTDNRYTGQTVLKITYV